MTMHETIKHVCTEQRLILFCVNHGGLFNTIFYMPNLSLPFIIFLTIRSVRVLRPRS